MPMTSPFPFNTAPPLLPGEMVRDLEKFVGTNFSDATDNPLRECALQSLGIPHGVNGLANLDTIAVAKGERLGASGRDLEHHQIAFRINRSDAFDVKLRWLANELCVSSRSAFENVKVARDLAVPNKEAAAKRKRLAVGVFHHQENGRRRTPSWQSPAQFANVPNSLRRARVKESAPAVIWHWSVSSHNPPCRPLASAKPSASQRSVRRSSDSPLSREVLKSTPYRAALVIVAEIALPHQPAASSSNLRK